LKVPGAWLAAAIFALHPVQVESVAWVTERKNVLSAVFYFSAALAYLKYSGIGNKNGKIFQGEMAPSNQESPPHPPRRRPLPRGGERWGEGADSGFEIRRESAWYQLVFYYTALILYVGALLSKTVACSLPAALLLVVWWKKGGLQLRHVLSVLPFFLIGIGMGLATAWIEWHHVAAHGPEWSLSFAERGLIAGRALCFYVGKLAWPHPLIFIYPRWHIDTALWWQWLYPVAVITVVLGLWLARRRIGKGALVGMLFFCGTLFPALGFVNVYPMRFSFVADHFQYLACVGMIAMGAVWLVRLPKAAILALLLVLGCLTYQQARTYRTIETVWRTTLSRNPGCWMAENNLGMVLVAQNELEEAESRYRAGLLLKPDEESIHYNLANLLVKTGRLDEGIEQYNQALRLKPDDADAHNNLGIALFEQHHTDAAIAEFQQAVAFRPDFPNAWYDLGNAFLAEHKTAEAILAFQQGLRLEPDSVLFKKRLQGLGVPAN